MAKLLCRTGAVINMDNNNWNEQIKSLLGDPSALASYLNAGAEEGNMRFLING